MVLLGSQLGHDLALVFSCPRMSTALRPKNPLYFSSLMSSQIKTCPQRASTESPCKERTYTMQGHTSLLIGISRNHKNVWGCILKLLHQGGRKGILHWAEFVSMNLAQILGSICLFEQNHVTVPDRLFKFCFYLSATYTTFTGTALTHLPNKSWALGTVKDKLSGWSYIGKKILFKAISIWGWWEDSTLPLK